MDTQPLMREHTPGDVPGRDARGISTLQAPPAAVAWGAIIAGTVAIMAANLVLLTLGAGLGLSAASPWTDEGLSAEAVGIGVAIWMIVVQLLAAALGGYLTGRLRFRWTSYHGDEVYFRDTAHGFLAFAFAVILTALVASVMTAGTVGGAIQGAAQGATQSGSSGDGGLNYLADSLFRSDRPTAAASSDDVRAETTRILARSVANGVASADRIYLARLAAARAGISEPDAQRRVEEVIAKAKSAADSARKATATAAIATALSLVVGGFIAAFAAATGGRERDD